MDCRTPRSAVALMVRDGEAQRNARKRTDRPQPRHAATRAMALNVREAIGGELLNGRAQRVQGPQNIADGVAPILLALIVDPKWTRQKGMRAAPPRDGSTSCVCSSIW